MRYLSQTRGFWYGLAFICPFLLSAPDHNDVPTAPSRGHTMLTDRSLSTVLPSRISSCHVPSPVPQFLVLGRSLLFRHASGGSCSPLRGLDSVSPWKTTRPSQSPPWLGSPGTVQVSTGLLASGVCIWRVKGDEPQTSSQARVLKWEKNLEGEIWTCIKKGSPGRSLEGMRPLC